MKISVAIATFNGADFVRNQLDSIFKQTLKPDEIVVSDDASSDETVQILTSMQLQAPCTFKVIQNRVNVGYIRNFEKAISACTGDLIFLADQDDYWASRKVARCVEHYKTSSCSLCIHDSYIASCDLKDRYGRLSQRLQRNGLSLDLFHTNGCQTFFTRQFRDLAVPFPEGVISHDIYLHWLANSLGQKHFLNEVLIDWRRHVNGASGFQKSSLGIASKLKGLLAIMNHWDVFSKRRKEESEGVALTWNMIAKVIRSRAELFDDFRNLKDDSLLYIELREREAEIRREFMHGNLLEKIRGYFEIRTLKQKIWHRKRDFVLDLLVRG